MITKKSFFLCLLTTSLIIFAPTRVNSWENYRDELHFELLTIDDDTHLIDSFLIKDYLEAIGFRIDYRSEPVDILYPKFSAFGGDTIREYDLIYMMMESITYNPTDLYAFSHSLNDYPGGENLCGFHNSTLDNHLDLMHTSTMDQVQYHVYQQQAILAEEVPYVHVLYHKESIPVWHGMSGLISTPNGFISPSNPLTTLNFHNITTMPANRNGTEWVMRYPFHVLAGNTNGMLYYQSFTGRTAYVDRLLWEPLIIINETGNIIPWLAETRSVSPDLRTISFTLRENITWHDGVAMTPEDVKFSFDYIKIHEMEVSDAHTYRIANCTLDSDGTINFHMKDLDSWGIYNFLDLVILPKHIFESIPIGHPSWNDLANKTTKIGSGPYKFSRVEDISLPNWWQFVRNDDYWFRGDMLTSLATGIQYPRMEKFTIQVIVGVNDTVMAFKNGTIDNSLYFWPDITEEVRKYTNDITIVDAPIDSPSIWRKILFINNQIYPLSDKFVRQAIAYAINYDAIVEEDEHGYGIPMYNQYLPEIIHGDWHNSLSDNFNFNISKANQLLDDAGYLDTNGDGIREIPPGMRKNTTTSSDETTTHGTGLIYRETILICFGAFLTLGLFSKKFRIRY
ncbi:MAG: ABC transporter substrate-binding protein [Candidatus Hodarchaeales archaeon]|jgi:peptide/nickel transport system substrate-binding protein